MEAKIAILRSAYAYFYDGVQLVSENLSLCEHQINFEVAASPFVALVRPSEKVLEVFQRLEELYFALGCTGFLVAIVSTALFAMTQVIFQSKRAAARLKQLRQPRSSVATQSTSRYGTFLRLWRQHASVVDNTVPFWRSQLGLELEQAVVIAGFFGMGVVFTLLHMGINV